MMFTESVEISRLWGLSGEGALRASVTHCSLVTLSKGGREGGPSVKRAARVARKFIFL